ncbi:PilZ domain-containing protein [Amphritea sp. 2_MG-2023]|uniref:PilZ domain-containing protein n=1 Tax=Amphritea TaxID=515417 RepID=UPI001C0656BB|nr:MULTISPECIES: PilZ domain-containing protein [Amphritea]MBU2966498.1 PilZ domain-containing protein [Amphritea atlantica]MDO6417643.1 PilZ domain-containing protein [Amphritea sp. 2_MG-2023]
MKLIHDDTLEFEEISSDSESIQVSRKSYRIPVKDRETSLLIMNGSTYPLVDISVEGVCIGIDATAPLTSADITPDCKIILGEQHFEGLVGEVMHSSLDGDGNWICGIQWQQMDEATFTALDQALLRLRKEIFADA